MCSNCILNTLVCTDASLQHLEELRWQGLSCTELSRHDVTWPHLHEGGRACLWPMLLGLRPGASWDLVVSQDLSLHPSGGLVSTTLMCELSQTLFAINNFLKEHWQVIFRDISHLSEVWCGSGDLESLATGEHSYITLDYLFQTIPDFACLGSEAPHLSKRVGVEVILLHPVFLQGH